MDTTTKLVSFGAKSYQSFDNLSVGFGRIKSPFDGLSIMF
jgi:hypothetical protein